MHIKLVGPEAEPAFRRIQHHILQAVHELHIEATLETKLPGWKRFRNTLSRSSTLTMCLSVKVMT